MLPSGGVKAYLESRENGQSDGLAISQLYRRYAYAIGQVPAPDITAEELDLICRSGHSTWLEADDDPIELLLRVLATAELDILSHYHCSEEFNLVKEGFDHTKEMRTYSDLSAKIEQWSPLQGLKVIEAIECLNAKHVSIVDLTPEMMVSALNTLV